MKKAKEIYVLLKGSEVDNYRFSNVEFEYRNDYKIKIYQKDIITTIQFSINDRIIIEEER